MYKYLVAYKFSVSLTNGEETIPAVENVVESDIFELEKELGINQALIQIFESRLEKDMTSFYTTDKDKEAGYFPEIEVKVLSITKLMG